MSPADEEKPLFVLLEDDRQVSKFSAEADVLLEPAFDRNRRSDVDVVISVDVRPYLVTVGNLSFTS
jgi:hypothetical protein